MLGQLEALAEVPRGDAAAEVEQRDRPAIGHQHDVVVVDRQRGPRPLLVLALGILGAAAAVAGLEDQDRAGLAHLEHDPLRADPEVRVDRARQRRERPVDQSGVAVEGDQLARRRAGRRRGPPTIRKSWSRAGARRAGVRRPARPGRTGWRRGGRCPAVPRSYCHCSAPFSRSSATSRVCGRGDDLVGQVADPDRRLAELDRPERRPRGRVDRAERGPLRQEDPARLGRRRHPVGARSAAPGRPASAPSGGPGGPAGSARRGRSIIRSNGARASRSATSARQRAVPGSRTTSGNRARASA